MSEHDVLLGGLMGSSVLIALGVVGYAFRQWREERAYQRTLVAWAETLAEPPDHRAELRKKPQRLFFALRGVCKSYREPDGKAVTVLKDVSLDLWEGMTGLVGVSGRGKSTLIHLLGALDVPDKGTLCFRGRKLPGRQGEELRRFRAESVAVIFQDLNLVTHANAQENAALALQLRGLPRRRALAAARKALTHLDIGDLAHRRPAELSGGQKQRVAIARAVASEAPVLLCDEPTGSLDAVTADRVMQTLAQLTQFHGRSVLVVTHDRELADKYCDRLLEFTPEGIVETACRKIPVAEVVTMTEGS